jgi:hypothetical protein
VVVVLGVGEGEVVVVVEVEVVQTGHRADQEPMNCRT